jgi:hypothetical protein
MCIDGRDVTVKANNGRKFQENYCTSSNYEMFNFMKHERYRVLPSKKKKNLHYKNKQLSVVQESRRCYSVTLTI